MALQIDAALKRGRGYWFVDGFIEIAAGVLFVLLSLLLLASGTITRETYSAWLLSVAGIISSVKIIGLIGAFLILWWLKDHFTYPRGEVRKTDTPQIWPCPQCHSPASAHPRLVGRHLVALPAATLIFHTGLVSGLPGSVWAAL
jgi:hypothetical protein